MPPADQPQRETDLRLEDFSYELPPELIAQEPLAERSSSKLLVLHRADGHIEHRRFTDIADYFSPGDVLVLNDSRVFPARLSGKKPTGGKSDILLVQPEDESAGLWRALVKPKIKPGREVLFADTDFRATCVTKHEDGSYTLQFNPPDARGLAEAIGSAPLPPYIRRQPEKKDLSTYQTVFARHEGSIAAPTAGLHFTPLLLESLAAKGVECVFVTLHVGLGTFQPVRDIPSHRMHTERFCLSEETAARLNMAREEKRRIWSVGTTATRVLETCSMGGDVVAGEGETDLFILPPFDFEVVGGLITNFHLSESTLLMLVSAFAGRERILNTYHQAVQNKYRFFSYGDAMLIV